MPHASAQGNTHHFSVIVDRIEEDRAVLELEGGEIMSVPLTYMPDEIGEGDALRISFETAASHTEEQKQTAQDLLNDILHTKHS